MKNALLFLFSICLISCCNQTDRLDNGLTKKANKLIEYSIYVELDSLNKEIYDTLAITQLYYNNNDKIVRRSRNTLIDGERIEVDFVYDEFDKIQQEIVSIPRDSTSFTVNYIYKDSLIDKCHSTTENNVFKFTSIADYTYNQNVLKKISTESIYIDLETNDTITHNVETSFYNEIDLLTESIINDFIKPERNSKTINEYGCNSLLESRKKYHNDSLIATTNFIHEQDKYGNWVKRMSFSDGKLKFVRTREIFYK
jgi:hypothetical protein